MSPECKAWYYLVLFMCEAWVMIKVYQSGNKYLPPAAASLRPLFNWQYDVGYVYVSQYSYCLQGTLLRTFVCGPTKCRIGCSSVYGTTYVWCVTGSPGYRGGMDIGWTHQTSIRSRGTEQYIEHTCMQCHTYNLCSYIFFVHNEHVDKQTNG